MEKAKKPDEPTVIKKYANRRLYNTATSTYVTLDDLCEMVKKGEDFNVFDAKSGDDLTRSVLTQIIFEQEAKGQNLLPVNFLRRIIGFYDNSVRELVPHYLESSLETFSLNQDKMKSYVDKAFDTFFPLEQLEELGKQNFQMFQKAMSMFNPFEGGAAPGSEKSDKNEKK